mmetsp:Transcript_25669/g.47830  ORF Transcript_25669/g.47830 Transcript_25669/m.47830 type:complete len:355 (+) Transcript_25669:483-1547(+)
MVLGFVSTNTVPEGPLSISINVHLDDTGFNGISDIFNTGTRSSVEDELHGLIISVSKLLGDVLLSVVKNDGLELDISRSIHSVDITEGSGTGEGGVGNLGELFIGVINFLGLSVKTSRVNVSVINTILFSSSDTEFELEQDIELGEFLHVFLANGNILLQRFLRKVKHVGREKRLSVDLVVFLVGGNQTVHPWQPCLLAVVSVEDDRNTVKCGNFVHMLGGSNASSNGGLVIGVVGGLSGNELTTSLGESDHDGASILGSGFHTGVDRVCSDNIHSRNGKACLLGVVKKVDEGLSSDNTRLDGSGQLGKGLGLGLGRTHLEGRRTAVRGTRGKAGGGGEKEEGGGELHDDYFCL